MSIIVYWPHRVGRIQNAELLRSYFCCEEVVDADFDPYPISKQQVEEFVNGTILFLTDIPPTKNNYATHHDYVRRVFAYDLAMTAAGKPNGH